MSLITGYWYGSHPIMETVYPSSFLFVLPILLLLTQQSISQCIPGSNCDPPDCRCPQDNRIPGNIPQTDTPQMVLVSFQYAVNVGNEKLYTSIFDGINNPNDCPATGTLFVQKTNSDFSIIKSLYDRKHEVGVTTVSGTLPSTAEEWSDSLRDVKIALEEAGIPAKDTLGVRSPSLTVGGNDEFDALVDSQLIYDSSCVTQQYVTASSLLWPYTYDFISDTPVCTIGKDPTKPYKGIWQFLIPDLQVGDQKCATPSACSPFINSTQEAFDLLYNGFANHYEGQRSPFVLYIDALWLTVDFQKEATQQFLQFIRGGFEDTWIITTQQSLAWIKDPTPISSLNDFDPWKC